MISGDNAFLSSVLDSHLYALAKGRSLLGVVSYIFNLLAIHDNQSVALIELVNHTLASTSGKYCTNSNPGEAWRFWRKSHGESFKPVLKMN